MSWHLSVIKLLQEKMICRLLGPSGFAVLFGSETNHLNGSQLPSVELTSQCDEKSGVAPLRGQHEAFFKGIENPTMVNRP